MELTQFSHYGLRVLMSLGLTDERTSIRQVSRAFRLSENHMAVVVHRLSKLGYVRTTRGHGGGIQLARPQAAISIGTLIEQLEPHFALAECLADRGSDCQLLPVCRLRKYLLEARSAFLQVLHRYTLEDVLTDRSALRRRLMLGPSQRNHQGRHETQGQRKGKEAHNGRKRASTNDRG